VLVETSAAPPPLAPWGLRAASALLVVGGLDPDARLWQVVDDEGRTWAVKSSRRDVRFGALLALDLARGGDLGVAAPLPTLQGDAWHRDGDRLVTVTAWVDGDDAAEDGLDPEGWRLLGATVRAVHEHRVPVGAHAPRRGIKRVGRRALVRLRDLDQRLRPGGDEAERVPELASRWHEHRRRLAALHDLGRELKATRTPTARVPCHGDPHLGNVVVDRTGRPWLVDLDEATVAPREVDLVLVELGVLPHLPITDDDLARFHEGYGPTRLDEARLLRFGSVRALEDVTATADAVAGAHSPTEAHDALAALDDLLGPKGLVALVEGRVARARPGGHRP